MEIINNQRDAATSIGELRQHPAGHRRCIEVRCRCRLPRRCLHRWHDGPRRAGPARTAGRRAGRVAPAQGEPVRLARTAGPGAQQRRLPAACRGRDDRHLPRRRAIQGSDKITPVDQPGSCWSHRHRPALISTPDTLAPVTQSGHLLSRYQASARTVNGARTLGSAALSSTSTRRRRDPSAVF